MEKQMASLTLTYLTSPKLKLITGILQIQQFQVLYTCTDKHS